MRQKEGAMVFLYLHWETRNNFQVNGVLLLLTLVKLAGKTIAHLHLIFAFQLFFTPFFTLGFAGRLGFVGNGTLKSIFFAFRDDACFFELVEEAAHALDVLSMVAGTACTVDRSLIDKYAISEIVRFTEELQNSDDPAENKSASLIKKLARQGKLKELRKRIGK